MSPPRFPLLGGSREEIPEVRGWKILARSVIPVRTSAPTRRWVARYRPNATTADALILPLNRSCGRTVPCSTVAARGVGTMLVFVRVPVFVIVLAAVFMIVAVRRASIRVMCIYHRVPRFLGRIHFFFQPHDHAIHSHAFSQIRKQKR